MNLTPWAWLIVPLGATRLLQLVLHDRLLKGPRDWLLARLNPEDRDMNDPERGYLSYLVECPWCLSVWLGALIVGALLWDASRAAALGVLLVLALSELAVFLDRVVDRLTPDQPVPPRPPSTAPNVEQPPPHVQAALAAAARTGDDTAGPS